jgi:mono/diheme cytochrome c family protein/cytochrome c553
MCCSLSARLLLALAAGFTLVWPLGTRANEPSAEQLEFFEKRVRPVLATHCYACHAQGKSEGFLRLDAREAMLSGGDRGPAIVPGRADDSLLIQAVRHLHEDLQMPLRGKALTPAQIEDLAAWINAGAAWPTEVNPAPVSGEGAQHWCFLPLTDPVIPEVKDSQWATSPIDRFILARLESEGLTPAPPAAKRDLLRRVTFDLWGLPPTPEMFAEFLADEQPDAYERLIDRLLASPHYGERWARHWLDIVRFAETNGQELDRNKPNAFRFRDYVIEALNQDLPYDQFVTEQIAGDLLPNPRVSADGQRLEAPIASGLQWLGEFQSMPVNEALAQAVEVENQVDVLGKAFLGLTLACARCHDHKFDPISTEDYYAVAGYLYSTENVQACVDSPAQTERIATAQRQLSDSRIRSNAILQRATATQRLQQAGQVAEVLEAIHDHFLSGGGLEADAIAARHADVDRGQLEGWCKLIEKQATQGRDPVVDPWVKVAAVPDRAFLTSAQGAYWRLIDWEPSVASSQVALFDDFEDEGYGDRWIAAGQAFGTGPARELPDDLVNVQGRGFVDSYRGNNALRGRLTSRRFKVEKRWLSFLIAGGDYPAETCVNIKFHSAALPEPDDFTATGSRSHRFEQRVIDLRPFLGRQAILEVVDERTDEWGHILADNFRFWDVEPPAIEAAPIARLTDLFIDPQVRTHGDLAQHYQQLITTALEQWSQKLDAHAAAVADATARGEALPEGPAGLDDWDLEVIRRWALSPESPLATNEDPIQQLSDEARSEVERLRAAQQEIERTFPESSLAMVSHDLTGRDIPVHQRGNPDDPGDVVRRGFPKVLSAGDAPDPGSGSGRLELAKWITSPQNPLTARVLVNRLWQHHFGRGLAAMPDNFGILGQAPTHPELLDYLASRFLESGQSLKAMHRLMLLSNTYRQSSVCDEIKRQDDPDNHLLARMPVRRLEAECVRDAILTAAGTLNPTMYGRGVRLYVTPFMLGTDLDLPRVSGPLDGDCRRSIYLELRRNHLMPLLAAFDLPKPDSTVGRRETSIVPAQALVLLNNEFVADQTERWAERLLAKPQDPAERVNDMFLAALARPAEADEIAAALKFVETQAVEYRQGETSPEQTDRQCWADLAQTLFNLGEFILIQ